MAMMLRVAMLAVLVGIGLMGCKSDSKGDKSAKGEVPMTRAERKARGGGCGAESDAGDSD